MRYAVLFKTHQWGEFEQRQLARLQACCEGGDIFVFKDQGRQFHGIPKQHRTLYASEADCVALGLLREPAGNVFWYNNDYPHLYFHDQHPDYDYVVGIEYDVACNVPIGEMVADMHQRGIDCVAHPTDTTDWHWKTTGQGIYAPELTLHGGLFCFAAFSRAAVAHLFARRRHLAEQYRSGVITSWPYGELFMATELAHNGFILRPLSEYANVDRYNWWPPAPEADIAVMPELAMMHPVLDEDRYIRSCLKADLASYLDPDSNLRRWLDRCEPGRVLPLLFDEARRQRLGPFVAQMKQTIGPEDRERLGAHANIALGKPSTQSSVCQWSRRQLPHLDAAGGNDGRVDADYGFHTDMEDQPWWMVDLESVHAVTEIRLFNRLDMKVRARDLSVLVSLNALDWQVVAVRKGLGDFGGADGNPLIVVPEPGLMARYVRVQLGDRSILHLAQVQVFGEPT